MRDYITEASRFMYDDNYVTEAKVAVDGKKYASKKAAEEDLKKKGLKGRQVADKMEHSHEVKMDAVFNYEKEKKAYHKSAEKHGVTVHHLKGDRFGHGLDNVKVTGSKENLEKFIKKHHDDGTGEPAELEHIKQIKK